MSFDKAVGFKGKDQPVAWGKRDLLAYALGVGAKNDDYQLVYELNEHFRPMPTYPVVLPFKGTDNDVNLFANRMKGEPIPGLPAFNPKRVVHATQAIEILKPLPLVSGEGWKMTKTITGVNENKSGVIVVAENNLVDPHGEVYAKLHTSSFNLGAKITGQKVSKSISNPPTAKPIPKDTKPSFVYRDKTSPEQATIFRLSGDYNPLHIDPKIGEAGGFGGVILHGLSTYGFAARAVIMAAGGGDPDSLRVFGVRFTSPVKPGDELETRMYEVGVKDGLTELAFETVNLNSGKTVLGAGIAVVKKAEEKSKL